MRDLASLVLAVSGVACTHVPILPTALGRDEHPEVVRNRDEVHDELPYQIEKSHIEEAWLYYRQYGEDHWQDVGFQQAELEVSVDEDYLVDFLSKKEGVEEVAMYHVHVIDGLFSPNPDTNHRIAENKSDWAQFFLRPMPRDFEKHAHFKGYLGYKLPKVKVLPSVVVSEFGYWEYDTLRYGGAFFAEAGAELAEKRFLPDGPYDPVAWAASLPSYKLYAKWTSR